MSSEDFTIPEQELIQEINKVIGEEKPKSKKKRCTKKVEKVEETSNEDIDSYREKIGCVVASGQSRIFFWKRTYL